VRAAILILMIALLPLRLWAADDMAIRMAAQGDSAITAMAAESMPPDCPMLAQANDTGQEGTSSHCMACHLCAASAVFEHGAVLQVLAAASLTAEGVSRFASAVPPRDQRPPIP
jgi:hypothetical protein